MRWCRYHLNSMGGCPLKTKGKQYLSAKFCSRSWGTDVVLSSVPLELLSQYCSISLEKEWIPMVPLELHRIIELFRNLKDHPVSSRQVVQGPTQPSLEHFQGQSSHFSGQPVPVPPTLTVKNLFLIWDQMKKHSLCMSVRPEAVKKFVKKNN